MEKLNLFEGTNDYSRAAEVKPLINKWTKTGLLEGLRGGNEKSTVAVLLENQAKQLIKEGSAESSGMGSAGAGFEQWHGVALPLVRRIFAEIAAKEFVSVQPMNLPSGLVFYLDFKYGTDKQPFGFSPGSKDQVGTLQGITTASTDATDGLYGAGRFGFSVNYVGTGSGLIATGAAALSDVNFDGGYTASIVGGHALTNNWKTLTFSNFFTLNTNADPYAVRSFIPLSGSNNAALTANTQYLPAFTRKSGNDLVFVVTGSTAVWSGATVATAVSYSIQPQNDNRSDFEYRTQRASATSAQDLDINLNIPEIELQMRSIPVTAKTRKLKASWTPEFAQDLNAYHSVDAEAELTSMLSEYVSMEIDLEILDMLINAAATTEYWSARIGREYNAAGQTLQTQEYTGTAYIQGTWFQTLGTKLQKVSNQIHAKTLRGGANFLVCSPNVATILESIPGYAADTDGLKMKFAMGVQKVGSITSRYQVYKNPYMQENTILMGFRGSQFLETGAVYAPYIPLMMTPLVYDPNNFIPRRGVMTRYAKVVTRPEFYGKVYVADLNTL
jgi:hypothetical protein